MRIRGIAVTLLTTLLLAVATTAAAIPPPVSDPSGDVATGDIDVTGFDAGILPPDSPFVPTDPPPFPPGTPVTYIWARFTFEDGAPPSVDRNFVSTSMFITDPERTGDEAVHLSAFTGFFGDTGRCDPPDSPSCAFGPFPVVGRELPDGSVLIVACVPFAPTELRMRGAAAVVGDDNTIDDIDRVPEFPADPTDTTAEPVDLTPREPTAPPDEVTTTTSTTAVPPTTTTVPPATTITEPRSQPTDPTTTTTAIAADEDGGGGFPWWIILLILLALGGLGGWWAAGLLRKKDPCVDERLAWELAKRDCERARENARGWRDSFERTKQMREDLDRARDDLCREWPPACIDVDDEAFVELPGVPGSRLTTRDIRLREHFTGEAWERYISDPSPETARAAEEAWKEIDTPEFRREMQERDDAARAERESLDEARDDARRQEDDERRDLERAEQAERDACERAKKAEEDYLNCLKDEEEKRKKKPPPRPEPPPQPQPPTTPGGPTPPPPGPGPGPGGGPPPPPGPGPCKHGDKRWEIVSGPHPFRVRTDWERRGKGLGPVPGEQPITVTVNVRGTSRAAGNDYSIAYDTHRIFLPISDAGKASYDDVARITREQVDAAFRPLHEMYEQLARARTTVVITIPVTTVTVACERELECVHGAWVTTGRRRCEPVEPEGGKDTITIQREIRSSGPGAASKDETEILAEFNAVFGQAIAQVKRLAEAEQMIEDLCADCMRG